MFESDWQDHLRHTFEVHEVKNCLKSAWVPGNGVEHPVNWSALLMRQLFATLLVRSCVLQSTHIAVLWWKVFLHPPVRHAQQDVSVDHPPVLPADDDQVIVFGLRPEAGI